MSITPETGSGGKVLISSTSVGEITKWTFNKNAVVTQFGSSESAGYKKAIAGTKFGSGTIEGKWDGALTAPIKEGTSATLLLYTNASEFYSVPAIMSNFTLSVDMNDGTPNSFTATFMTNGAWAEPTLA